MPRSGLMERREQLRRKILAAIGRGETATQNQIAKRLGIPPNSIGRAMHHLVAKGALQSSESVSMRLRNGRQGRRTVVVYRLVGRWNPGVFPAWLVPVRTPAGGR